MAIPHINLTGDPNTLNPTTQQWNLVSKTMRNALETYGCFLVDYDDISGGLRQQMFASMESLFSLPPDSTKQAVDKLPSTITARYNPGQNPDALLDQALGIVNAHDPTTAGTITDLLWPDGNDSFRETMKTVSKKMRELVDILMKMICYSYGLDTHCEHLLENTETFLHMIKYAAPMTDKPTLGTAKHVDASFLTILFQNNVNGLVVKTKDGDWMPVNPTGNTFVVQTGLLFKALSNARVHVPLHEVLITGDDVRLTCAFFLHPKPEVMVETPREAVDEEHPVGFKPFKFGEFYKFFRGRLALEDSLDVFAGV